MNFGFEIVAARPKGQVVDPLKQQSMRAGTGDKVRRNPSTDQKKVRRQLARSAALDSTTASLDAELTATGSAQWVSRDQQVTAHFGRQGSSLAVVVAFPEGIERQQFPRTALREALAWASSFDVESVRMGQFVDPALAASARDNVTSGRAQAVRDGGDNAYEEFTPDGTSDYNADFAHEVGVPKPVKINPDPQWTTASLTAASDAGTCRNCGLHIERENGYWWDPVHSTRCADGQEHAPMSTGFSFDGRGWGYPQQGLDGQWFYASKTAGFWDDIHAQYEALKSAKSADDVLRICPKIPGMSAGDGFFEGSGGDEQVYDALLAAGWKTIWMDADYFWAMRAPNGDVISYVEGDLYRGDQRTASRRTAVGYDPGMNPGGNPHAMDADMPGCECPGYVLSSADSLRTSSRKTAGTGYSASYSPSDNDFRAMQLVPDAVRPFDGQELLRQIGGGNIMAISGGRRAFVTNVNVGQNVSDKETVGLYMPSGQGYGVLIWLDANDTYVVCRTRQGAIKGQRSGLYADQVGEAAYQASSYWNVAFGSVRRTAATKGDVAAALKDAFLRTSSRKTAGTGYSASYSPSDNDFRAMQLVPDAVRPFDGQELLRQIGGGNIMAISGGRRAFVTNVNVGQNVSDKETVGLYMPSGQGYGVLIWLDANDTYVVCRTRQGAIKGQRSGLYADQVGEAAYQASSYWNVAFGSVRRTAATKGDVAAALKDAFDAAASMYFLAAGAHWNVEGPGFQQYHALFETIYNDVLGSLDPIAENVRKLGFPAPASVADVTGTAPPADGTDAISLVGSLLNANGAALAALKVAFDAASAADEQGVANFLADRIDMHQKWGWQLSASSKTAGRNDAPPYGSEDWVNEQLNAGRTIDDIEDEMWATKADEDYHREKDGDDRYLASKNDGLKNTCANCGAAVAKNDTRCAQCGYMFPSVPKFATVDPELASRARSWWGGFGAEDRGVGNGFVSTDGLPYAWHDDTTLVSLVDGGWIEFRRGGATGWEFKGSGDSWEPLPPAKSQEDHQRDMDDYNRREDEYRQHQRVNDPEGYRRWLGGD